MDTYKLKVAGVERDLPLCKLKDDLYIAAFVIFGDVELTTDSNIITLSTCIGSADDQRYIVQAVLTDENADPQALLDKAAEDFQRDYLDKYNSGAEAQ